MAPLHGIPVLLGPTASGKTSVGLALARHFNGEIISVDSRKVYRGLRVGTAAPEGVWKDTLFTVNEVPHHLIGVRDPESAYTAGDFAQDAKNLILEIRARGRIPILVGGTGFYFKALQKGLPTLPKRSLKVRSELETQIQEKGLPSLYDELLKIDPVAANRIAAQDRHKIIRALEVSKTTGRPYSDWLKGDSSPSKEIYWVMGLQPSKELLEKRIKERSQDMEKKGMIEETDALLKDGVSPEAPALASFGYREAVQVLQGKIHRKDFLPLLIKGTKAYSKRQRTWFRTQVQPTWFEIHSSMQKEEIVLKMRDFLLSHSN